MKYNINCIYNYYDTLLSEWGEWNRNPTVKLEVQLRHRLPPSLERSGKGGGRRWKPGIRVIR
ncbi:hypothetical protein, partial [Bacteroides sp. An269]|uniref:hypothetical protein n=1 Tax=Bacteroides sp. An269 TaxID=1965613 RepID=UPI001178AC5D